MTSLKVCARCGIESEELIETAKQMKYDYSVAEAIHEQKCGPDWWVINE